MAFLIVVVTPRLILPKFHQICMGMSQDLLQSQQVGIGTFDFSFNLPGCAGPIIDPSIPSVTHRYVSKIFLRRYE